MSVTSGGHALKAWIAGGSLAGSAGSAGMSMIFLTAHFSPSRYQVQIDASIWTWYRDGEKWAVKKIIDIPAEPADPAKLPPAIQAFKACPPLVTDIDLSVDDRYLYVACWGTGDLQQYDVSDPFKPKLTGKVRIGGIVARANPTGGGPLNGGPQMVEVSRDGRRVYFTNSLYGPIDPQFYPDGVDGWMVKLDVGDNGGIKFDEKFFVDWPNGRRPHQVRLE